MPCPWGHEARADHEHDADEVGEHLIEDVLVIDDLCLPLKLVEGITKHYESAYEEQQESNK